MSGSLVIGASGLVGDQLVKILKASGEDPQSTYHSNPVADAEPLDIRQAAQVSGVFGRLQPRLVFLSAALTNVDFCEANPELSYQANVVGVKNIVDECNKQGARLVYFSSDYIFDGLSGPYDELATANPVNIYGEHKLIAEHYVALAIPQALIVRTTVVYGWERQEKNFVYRLLRSLRAGTSLSIPMDQVGTPTYAPELALAVVNLTKVGAAGVFNIAGSSRLSRFEFALEAASIFELPQDLIRPVTTQELNQTARRPLSAGLKTGKLENFLGTGLSTSSQGLRALSMQSK